VWAAEEILASARYKGILGSRTHTQGTFSLGAGGGNEGSAEGQNAGESLELVNSHREGERSVSEEINSDS
jgi:hypothetical protein